VTLTTPTPHLADIRLHPIKSLDPVSVPEARISSSGGLALDRAWALYSVDGKWVNGKRTPAIHLIRANYSPDVASVTLTVPTDRRKIPPRTFAFPQDHEDASEWFSVFFEQQIIVRYSEGGFPDDSIASGPTIVSTASLQAIADWFPATSDASLSKMFADVSAPRSRSMASRPSGKINCLAKTNAASSVSPSARFISKAAIPAPGARYLPAIPVPASTWSASKNILFASVNPLCPRGLPATASTIFIVCPPTRAYQAPNPASNFASTTR
jgi:hypothetical protein